MSVATRYVEVKQRTNGTSFTQLQRNETQSQSVSMQTTKVKEKGINIERMFVLIIVAQRTLIVHVLQKFFEQ